jgi:hypothetical protein
MGFEPVVKQDIIAEHVTTAYFGHQNREREKERERERERQREREKKWREGERREKRD